MKPGTLFFHQNFKFHDGDSANKIIVVLGDLRGITLVVKTTSQGKRYLNDHGCQVNHRFPNFHLIKNCCFLEKSTWVVLDEFYELRHSELLQKHFSGQINRMGMLSEELTIDLLKCAIQSEDISAHQTKIVQKSLDDFLSD